MPEPALPKLLYLGDVPIESSYHGSALLYRLLQQYPPDRLRIIEGNLFVAGAGGRLPNVRHDVIEVGQRRLLNTRFHPWYSRWLLFRAGSRVAQVRALLGDFTPEAVLTVGHGFTWATAARYCRDASVPLHFIIHDDWPRAVPATFRAGVDRVFGQVYRQAATRLCVSPFMVEDYERQYGARGTLLLPSRAPAAAVAARTAPGPRSTNQPLTFAFAGTINSPGYARLLRRLADSLDRRSGQLLIFGPLTPSQAEAEGLVRPNVRLGGLLTSSELLRRLRDEADVLFVPMSFAPEDAPNMRMSFPSKLTDYTAVGLPLLICGPPDCSAVRWAHQNPGVADVVTTDDAAGLDGAVDRLAGDPVYRDSLARTSQAAGDRDFSAASAQSTFHAALRGAAR